MITFNTETGEFSRDGKPVRLDSDGAHCFLGWMKSSAKHSPLIAERIRSFANWQMDLDGKHYSNEEHFKP